MTDIAVQVENLSKRYRIGQRENINGSRGSAVASLVTLPIRNFRRLRRLSKFDENARHTEDTLWALKDISFEVKEGEALGIIGPNGAGKSTLLKILTRITEPTEGHATISGRVGSLLEVGTGFHPELTGRENVYLNGSVLGMRRKEIERKFDDIVDFSGVEKFIDTPVKRYSTGMKVRLAFSVAAHVEPEVLLVDEVLAVGDAAFQRRCLGRMSDETKRGRTVLFVSHNMGAILSLCSRAVWIEDGQLKQDGPPHDVIRSYLMSAAEGQATWNHSSTTPHNSEVTFKSARLLTMENEPTAIVDYGSEFLVEVGYEIVRPMEDVIITIQVMDMLGNLIFESWDTDTIDWSFGAREPGDYMSTCKIPAGLLRPGQYELSIVAFVTRSRIIEKCERVLTFDVSELGFNLNAGRRGLIAPVLEWKVAQESIQGLKTP